MKQFVTAIFLLKILTGFCQVDLFFPLKNEFDWSKVEKQNIELKAKLIKDIRQGLVFNLKECCNFGIDLQVVAEMFSDLRKEECCDFEKNLHIIDFNGDGLNDVIYNGHISGSEAEYIIIFINTGKTFVHIFTEIQKFHKIVFSNDKVTKLYIQDGGCCCEYILINKIYDVDYSAKVPKMKLISQMQYLNNSVEKYPSNYFDKPVKFKVLNNKYNIRFSPILDDTTEVWYCGEPKNGNSLGKIKSGSMGYALAESIDATGRVWWYVAITPESKIYESMYHDDDIRPNTYKLGWISSRFVEVINE